MAGGSSVYLPAYPKTPRYYLILRKPAYAFIFFRQPGNGQAFFYAKCEKRF